MTQTGSPFLALWNDVAESRDADYDKWHTHEHVPERVSIPGIRSGRRYVATGAGTHRYFTLYDLESLETLETPAYRAVVDKPTEWSRAMRPDLRNFLRQPCRPLLRLGRGLAAHIATLRFAVPPHSGSDRVVQSLAAIDRSGIVVLRVGLVDLDAKFPIASVAQAGAGDRFVLVAEGTDVPALSDLVACVSSCLETVGGTDLQAQLYRFIFAVRHEDVDPDLWKHGRHMP